MLKKGLCLLIGIMMLFCQINVVHATNLASGAESAILIDANSQQVLYHKNETKRLYPASTTKIMTMILLFEAIKEKRINWNDTLSCSAYAASTAIPHAPPSPALDITHTGVLIAADNIR